MWLFLCLFPFCPIFFFFSNAIRVEEEERKAMHNLNKRPNHKEHTQRKRNITRMRERMSAAQLRIKKQFFKQDKIQKKNVKIMLTSLRNDGIRDQKKKENLKHKFIMYRNVRKFFFQPNDNKRAKPNETKGKYSKAQAIKDKNLRKEMFKPKNFYQSFFCVFL